MTVFVLDASITMRWFFDGGAHPHADAILDELVTGTSAAIVPVLWRYEVSAVLARAQSKGSIPAGHVADFMEDLDALPIKVDPESERRVFSGVHDIAVKYRLTSYDAAYLELAGRRDLPMATLDDELVSACRRAGIQIFGRQD